MNQMHGAILGAALGAYVGRKLSGFDVGAALGAVAGLYVGAGLIRHLEARREPPSVASYGSPDPIDATPYAFSEMPSASEIRQAWSRLATSRGQSDPGVNPGNVVPFHGLPS